MDISIIINTYNQYKFLKRCILSCKGQNFKKKFEILIVDSSEDFKSKNFYNQFKKINIIRTKRQHHLPCVNQFKCIKKAFNQSSGKIICLIDGDDFFSKKKLTYIYKNFKNKRFINQDRPYAYFENNSYQVLANKNNLKNYIFFKKFFNSWQNVYGTSCISIDRNTFKKFFKSNSNTQHPLLAIDTLLINFALQNNCFFDRGLGITKKSIHNENLDRKYSNYFTKLFWERRIQQHNYFRSFNKYYNLDFFITFVIWSIVKKL